MDQTGQRVRLLTSAATGRERPPPGAQGSDRDWENCGLRAVVTNSLDRAAFLGLLALFLLVLVLLVDVRITPVVAPSEIVGGGFAAEVAVDALVVDEILAGNVVGVSVC